MRAIMIILAAIPLSLTACGEAKKGFDEGVEKRFLEEFTNSCTTSAVKTGAAPAIARKLCTCSANKLAEKYSGSELLGVSQEQMMEAGNACLKEQGLPVN